jgi:hypothetical protein
MITGAPLPAWSDFAALLGRRPDPARLAEPWLKEGDRAVWFSRSAWSLAALAEAAQARLGRPAVVALPGLFCDSSLGPLRRTGARIQFYPVAETLDPDWPNCAPCDLFVLVHAFGRPADAATARAACADWDALLVEDCTHALLPAAGIGDTGDACLWSPHKLLPAPQGGLLALRSADAAAPQGPAPPLLSWLAKRLAQKLLPGRLLPDPARRGPARFEDDPAPAGLALTPAPGRAALKLLGRAIDGARVAAAKRRTLGHRLLEVLAMRPGWSPLFDPATITPYRLVMRCDAPDIAAARYQRYRQAGVPVESWPDLPAEVRADSARQRTALHLRATLLCFPVHQGLNAGEVIKRCQTVPPQDAP